VDFGRTKKKVAPRSVANPAAGRLRIRWGRNESRRMLSHLDNMRIIENAVRDSKIPVTLTQGVRPRMKLSFCPPLPMGFTSEAEFVDISLDQICSGPMIDNIRKSLPDGFELYEAKTVYAKSLSLSDAINRVVYIWPIEDELNVKELDQKISDILGRESIELTRKTKSGETQVDIRPVIFELKIENNELKMTLGIGGAGYARPTEVAKLLTEFEDNKVALLPFHRQEMYRVTDDGKKIEGIEL